MFIAGFDIFEYRTSSAYGDVNTVVRHFVENNNNKLRRVPEDYFAKKIVPNTELLDFCHRERANTMVFHGICPPAGESRIVLKIAFEVDLKSRLSMIVSTARMPSISVFSSDLRELGN